MEMGMDHLSDERCDFHDFGLFFGNFGPNLANFIPQITINNLKLVYYYDPMSRLGICTHSYQMEMGMDHLSDERCDFHDFGLFFGNFAPNLAYFSPIMVLFLNIFDFKG